MHKWCPIFGVIFDPPPPLNPIFYGHFRPLSLILFFIQSYKFNMSCVDDAGHFLHSDQLEFSTRHLSSLRSTKINENNNNQNRDSSSSHNQHSGHHSSFISKSDYLTEMNLKLLPAISNSIQVNLCQKHSFSHQLTHNMTKDCSLIYQFSTWKLQAQNMLCT